MKKLFILTGFIGVTATIISCGGNDQPGRAYMPDMTYSRAYETYTPAEERLKNSSVDGGYDPYFNGKPVPGTVARGEMAAYRLPNTDSGYALSAAIKNPLDPASTDLKEAERLYLINCGICHGAKLDGNGPLYKDGNGPYTSKPATLVGDAKYEAMTAGTMFHSVTYGKNTMGSYASQLSTKQRWMVVAYVKSQQSKGGAAAAPDTAAATKVVDTLSVVKSK